MIFFFFSLASIMVELARDTDEIQSSTIYPIKKKKIVRHRISKYCNIQSTFPFEFFSISLVCFFLRFDNEIFFSKNHFDFFPRKYPTVYMYKI